MYCKNCGSENKEGAKFCNKCGAPLSQPAQPSAPAPNYGAPQAAPQPNYGAPQTAPQPNYGAPQTPPQPNYGTPQSAPQPNYGAPQNIYGAPQNYAPVMGGGYGGGSNILAKFNLFHWIAMVLLLLTLIGMFTPWFGYKVKASASGQSKSEKDSQSFFDLFKDDDDSGESVINGKDLSDKKDKFDTRESLMKWFGLIGFIAAVAAIGLAFVNPKIMLCVAAGSAACFTVALIAGLSAASVMTDAFDEVLKPFAEQYSQYGLKYDAKAHIGIGLILSFGFAVAGTVMATVATLAKKKPAASSAFSGF
ncbi:MAG: zinc-ribbon domain-containing protein [Ruminococcus sp.]|nr:zinc-ribbon domain-containing protein [Ruminococcus sp.]